jgi:hypothetical protein
MTKRERAVAQRPALGATESRERPVAVVELMTTIGLALSTLVAATAVSIGIARAEVFGLRADGDMASLAIALLIGLLMLATGGLAAIVVARPKGTA